MGFKNTEHPCYSALSDLLRILMPHSPTGDDLNVHQSTLYDEAWNQLIGFIGKKFA